MVGALLGRWYIGGPCIHWGHGAPVHHLPGNVIPATVGLVYINLQPEYKLPSSTRFEQFRKFEKIGVGAPSSPAIVKETVSALGPSPCLCPPARQIWSS